MILFLYHTVPRQVTALFLTFLLLSSCASLQIGGGKEPRIVIIRNRSGADIGTVTIREAGEASRASRFGSLSPAPAGVSQAFIRPTDPPPFPHTIIIEWVDGEGRTHARDLSITKALRTATGSGDEALVFEIWPNEDVLVFVKSIR